ncbi:S9 family peptidase [Lysobacter solisilvae]|uniref:S9 family peptidase n=2 Tax=Agrilutibacter solisilvae TaxID=2763317 RepID=A0A974Y2H9_9GAMM|nr:prolyl oligopeptidase family serine peptidase [Lysobacter solisilvae]QSX80129.1 S9 family peptidase [Lysobacter solisilvae]
MVLALLTVAFAAGFLCPSAHAAGPAATVDVGAFVDRDRFDDIKLSPTGEYFAATAQFEDMTALVVIRRSDRKLMSKFGRKDAYVGGFWWASPDRIVFDVAMKIWYDDTPSSTGELFAMNVDGSESKLLIGARVNDGMEAGAALVDPLAGDDDNVIVAVLNTNGNPLYRVDRLDIRNGRNREITRAPVRRASFLTDHAGEVRVAWGQDEDSARRVFLRKAGDASDAEWSLINDDGVSGHREWPLGFSADNRLLYLQVEHAQGPDSVVALDMDSRERRELVRDAARDPLSVLYEGRVPIGVSYDGVGSQHVFFDPSAAPARLYRSLAAAFAGEDVRITSRTRDGRLALVQAWSDRNPGEFFVFDTVQRKAELLAARRDWLKPEQLGERRPVALTARDGLPLEGYVTLPAGNSAKGLPMVVLPHGGPFGVRDAWGFDQEAQLLARAGYAVLQLNFRGSSGRGRAFEKAGMRQWGAAMQDDLTDATRWAIGQGIADPQRVCIYGGSYGGYAALMGVVREPELYRCAVGYVGVYNLRWHGSTNSADTGPANRWRREWVGEGPMLAAASPNNLAAQVKVPVLLVAGGADDTASVKHTRLMEKELLKAKVPTESLYFKNEGHGFFVDAHRREFYIRLLTFLNAHIGGGLPDQPGARAAGR